METFHTLRPIAPFNDAVLPRRSGFDPPMPHSQVGDRSFEGRASLWMREIRHRNDHGIIRSHQMKRGQASNRPAQHPSNPAAGGRGVDFRVLHSGSQLNQTALVLPSAAPANRRQLLNLQVDPMAFDWNRAALPFFWAGVGSTRRHAGCARPSRCWRWENAAADPAECVWGRAGDAPAVPRSRRHDRRRSRLDAHGCAARRCDQRCLDGQSSAGSCGDARQIDGPTPIELLDTGTLHTGQGRLRVIMHSITYTVLSKHPPEVR